ncbi:MAG: VWA domain-containing protein [Bryobacteraceae bacterium]
MKIRWPVVVFLSIAVAGIAEAQNLSFPRGDAMQAYTTVDAIQNASINFNIFTVNSQNADGTSLQTPSGYLSKLDLKAPGKAQREYDKGYQLLMRKDSEGAVQHLVNATTIYPSYVAAHNALGTAYLNLNENEKARDEFTNASTLDDHLPNSYLNLGCAQLAIKQYPAAEEAFRKASTIAPLDVQLKLALSYGEYLTKDYPAVISTVQDVHSHKHQTAAVAHFFAAGAWGAQDNLAAARGELQLLLKEDPKSTSAEQIRKMVDDLKVEERKRAVAQLQPVAKITYSIGVPTGPSAEIAGRMAELAFLDMEEKQQIEDAEADPEPICRDCGDPAALLNPASDSNSLARTFAGPVFRATVDEVSIVFMATDNGRSVTNLTTSDIGLRDDMKAPSAILNFRNESELPLRLGRVIDSSNSVKDRLKFEQAAAVKFLEKVVTDKNDLAFVVGVNNSVLMVQDFTSDQTLTSHAINELAASGGTALWDAVGFAADKLKSRPETQPVARVLVVISDGEDNSSSATLREAIAGALRDEVAVYTVSTRELTNDEETAMLGDMALKTFSELTGGATYRPGSVSHLDKSFSELQEVIRSRYLISYKPAGFQRDGRYRPIDITAAKDGHKLRVYARRGYYASATRPAERPASVNQ